jgi:hypothetical protein
VRQRTVSIRIEADTGSAQLERDGRRVALEDTAVFFSIVAEESMHLHSNLGAFRALIYVKDQHGCDERHMRFTRVSPEVAATGVFALIAHRCDPGEIAGVIDQPPSDVKDLWPATSRAFRQLL